MAFQELCLGPAILPSSTSDLLPILTGAASLASWPKRIHFTFHQRTFSWSCWQLNLGILRNYYL